MFRMVININFFHAVSCYRFLIRENSGPGQRESPLFHPLFLGLLLCLLFSTIPQHLPTTKIHQDFQTKEYFAKAIRSLENDQLSWILPFCLPTPLCVPLLSQSKYELKTDKIWREYDAITNINISLFRQVRTYINLFNNNSNL